MDFWGIAAQACLLVVGFFLLVKGADWFVDGASWLASKLGIPQIVIGLTIVAFGTSLPEAGVSITSAINNSADIAIGNVLGSNILNIFLILGISALFSNLAVQKNTLWYEIPYIVVVSLLLMLLGFIGGELSAVDGIILWVFFILFFVYLIIISIKGKNKDELKANLEETKNIQPTEDTQVVEVAQKKGAEAVKMLLKLFVGIGIVVLGSQMSVEGARNIAREMGMSESLIGLTIVAFGTSLPELVTSVQAARKNEADIAIGNIVGSNIFNILFILGTSALITPIKYNTDWISGFSLDNIIATVAAIVLFVSILVTKDKKLKRGAGIVMLVIYAGYFAWLVGKDLALN